MFIIKKVSGISGNCTLGEGATKAQAWEDAFGPKPWTSHVKRSAKDAWVEEVPEEKISYQGNDGPSFWV